MKSETYLCVLNTAFVESSKANKQNTVELKAVISLTYYKVKLSHLKIVILPDFSSLMFP